jgi:hypothetical protein
VLHKVAFGKAVLAGAAGAAAWEIAARLLIVLGVPIFDIVRLLGTMGGDVGWAWWPLGFAMHVLVGAIWAIFYSYFFWATLRARPVVQGLVFSVIPMLLAGLVMVPQLGAMHPAITRGELPQPGIFGWRLGWGGPLGVVLGHVIFGLISGALYTRPVGYSTTRETRPLRFRRSRREEFAAQPAAPVPGRGFMFATGIECSYPTIENGRWRMDELRETGHYRQWRRDLELVRELGVRYLRYGPPLHRMFRGPGQYDWDFMDEVGAAMQQLGITPIVDLCHFGLPRWLGTFQNPEFPAAFAKYAAAFAQRYPWVRLYTPVNEMYVTARLSAVEGL